jgi:hypothetical protein
VFTWKGADYQCTPGKLVKGNLFGAGGLTSDYNLTLSVLSADLPEVGPEPDQYITYKTRSYRIDTVTISADQSTVTLACVDPNRGAGRIEREY